MERFIVIEIVFIGRERIGFVFKGSKVRNINYEFITCLRSSIYVLDF